MTKNKNLGNQIYTGLAGFGKIEAVFGAIVITFIAIVLFIIGIILLLHKTNRTKTTTATIISASCDKDPDNYNFDCSLKINYTINSTQYKNVEISTINDINYQESFTQGEEIKVFYDPRNPTNVSTKSDNNHVIGWILIILAIIIVIISWFWVWITKKSKPVAAAGGVMGIADLFRN